MLRISRIDDSGPPIIYWVHMRRIRICCVSINMVVLGWFAAAHVVIVLAADVDHFSQGDLVEYIIYGSWRARVCLYDD